MLPWRLAVSAILIPAIFAIFYVDHQIGSHATLLLAFTMLLAIRSVWEMRQLLLSESRNPNTLFMATASCLILVSSWLPRFQIDLGLHYGVLSVLGPIFAFYSLLVVFWFFIEACRYRNPGGHMTNLAKRLSNISLSLSLFCLGLLLVFIFWKPSSPPTWDLSPLGICTLALILTVFAAQLFKKWRDKQTFSGDTNASMQAEILSISYVAVLLTVASQLRWVAGFQAGYLVLGSLVIAAKSGDIGAYTLGRLFGKRKMIPRLSPGKTWMGFWGALLGAGAGSVAWLHFAPAMFDESWQPTPWQYSLLYGMIIGLVGLVGDLCESLIKRDVGKKDSAVLMPGFGGLLDLLDSVLYAGPIAYLLWQWLPLATWPIIPTAG